MDQHLLDIQYIIIYIGTKFIAKNLTVNYYKFVVLDKIKS